MNFFRCMILKCYLVGIGQILIDIFLSLAGSVSQPCGRVAVCGAGGMIHAISCLVNTPGTRLTLNTLMPTCPFYQPRAIQSSFHWRRREPRSLCLRVSVGSLPSLVTGRRGLDTDFGMFMRHAAAVFWPHWRGKGKLCPGCPSLLVSSLL